MIHVLFPRRVGLVNARKGAGKEEEGREGRRLLRPSCVNMTTFPLMRALCSSGRGREGNGGRRDDRGYLAAAFDVVLTVVA